MATRELYWNIEGYYLIYPLFIIAIGFFVYGLYRRYRLWKLGKPENRWREVKEGIKDIFVYTFGHKGILNENYPGIMHFSIFWGFFILTFATSIVALQADFGLNIFRGGLYLFIKVTANLFGLLAIIGTIMAVWRRYVQHPDRLDNNKDDAIVLSLIFLILLTGFLIEGVRMAVQPDPWGAYSFVGFWLALLFNELNQENLMVFHRVLWWIHLLLVMFFIGYFPYSKLLHIILAPLNQFFRVRGPIGIPESINFEDESLEIFGKSSLQEFSWKTLFNTDVCLRCGRCQDNCPAFLSGKHLNPKQTIQDIRTLMEEIGKAKYVSRKLVTKENNIAESAATSENVSGEEVALKGVRTLIGEVIPEEDIWACITCRSCEQQCPVFVEHVDKTIELRRYLVLMESRFPTEAQIAFRNMENNANPWGISWGMRGDFLKGLGVSTLEENLEAEILYWPGCSGAYDARNQKVSAALTKLLNKAGVNFAILGNEEKCCGDSARRLGNEYLFYSLATENINVMKGYGVKKIVTQCPHCFNVLKNEYPQLGGEFVVMHHTEFLMDLLKSGRLNLRKEQGKSIAYHDSCYLGRYNQIYNEPRELLKAVGLEVKEMKHSQEKGFCCGAGGGRMWLEEKEGERINMMRTDEALSLQPDFIGTACPFCLTMINDGITSREATEKVKVLDIAEILEQAI